MPRRGSASCACSLTEQCRLAATGSIHRERRVTQNRLQLGESDRRARRQYPLPGLLAQGSSHKYMHSQRVEPTALACLLKKDQIIIRRRKLRQLLEEEHAAEQRERQLAGLDWHPNFP